MRALAFSDIHGKWELLRAVTEKDADIYICLGDLTNGEEGIEEAAKILEPISDRLVCVPGNNERPETMRKYFPLVLHGDVWEHGGVRFGGIGGCPITPFNTVHEWEESEAEALLARIGGVDVLLSNAPPAGTRIAMTGSGIDAGSRALPGSYAPRG
ncbi:TPA: hypothetical protein EYP13_00395 [Candidatus Micrarchaeota archaeon]|nr:hypothetical protein [Candidatus Micrarchaeota archaeon]